MSKSGYIYAHNEYFREESRGLDDDYQRELYDLRTKKGRENFMSFSRIAFTAQKEQRSWLAFWVRSGLRFMLFDTLGITLQNEFDQLEAILEEPEKKRRRQVERNDYVPIRSGDFHR